MGSKAAAKPSEMHVTKIERNYNTTLELAVAAFNKSNCCKLAQSAVDELDVITAGSTAVEAEAVDDVGAIEDFFSSDPPSSKPTARAVRFRPSAVARGKVGVAT